MNLVELEHSLGIGFHDADLYEVSINFAKRTIELSLAVCIGDPDALELEERERMRKGKLVLSGFTYCALDPPDPRYPYGLHEPLDVDPCEPDSSLYERYALLPGAFAARFFITDWNSFLHFDAVTAEFSWQEDE